MWKRQTISNQQHVMKNKIKLTFCIWHYFTITSEYKIHWVIFFYSWYRKCNDFRLNIWLITIWSLILFILIIPLIFPILVILIGIIDYSQYGHVKFYYCFFTYPHYAADTFYHVNFARYPVLLFLRGHPMETRKKRNLK